MLLAQSLPGRLSAVTTTSRTRRARSSLVCQAQNKSALNITLKKPLGIVFEEVQKGAASGVYIAELVPGGNAARAGLQVGDVLVGVSAYTLKAGKEGEFESQGHGARPYTNWERNMIDVSVVDFDTVMGAISSNNERWGITDVELELERGTSPVAAPAAAPARQAAAPVRRVPPSVAVEAVVPGGAVLTCGTLDSTDTALRTVLLAGKAPVYASGWNGMMNCGGGGQCGMCAVRVTEGLELLDAERSKAELKFLSKKPESWRLSCQVAAAAGANGRLVVECQPKV